MNKFDRRNNALPESDTYIIEGRNAVYEALRTGRAIDKILYADGDKNISHILAAAKQAGTVVSKCDRRKLDSLSVSGAHQGVLAFAAAHEYSTIDDIFELEPLLLD